jgi:hypothetical protein
VVLTEDVEAVADLPAEAAEDQRCKMAAKHQGHLELELIASLDDEV